MKTKFENIFSKTECISLEMKRKYIKKKLSRKDMFLVEKHLLDCQMCSDEMEGLTNLKDINQLAEINNEIKHSVFSKSRKKSPKIFSLNVSNRILSMAAISIIVLGIAFIVSNLIDKKNAEYMAVKTESENDSSDKVQFERNKENDIVIDEFETETKALKTTKNIEEKIEQYSKTENKYMPAEEEIVETETIEKQNLSIAEAVELNIVQDVEEEEQIFEMLDESVHNEDIEQQVEDISLSEASQSMAIANVPKAVKKEEVQKSIARNEDKLASNKHMQISNSSKNRSMKNAIEVQNFEPQNLGKAISKFNSGKYKSAVKLFEKKILQMPNNYQAIYYAAVCYFELKKYEKSLDKFNSIISAKNIEFYEIAQLKKAEILIIHKKYADAELLLEEIIDNNGKFANEAFELLKKINK